MSPLLILVILQLNKHHIWSVWIVEWPNLGRECNVQLDLHLVRTTVCKSVQGRLVLTNVAPVYFSTVSTSTSHRMDEFSQKLATYRVHIAWHMISFISHGFIIFLFLSSWDMKHYLVGTAQTHTVTSKIKLWFKWKGLEPSKLYFPEGLWLRKTTDSCTDSSDKSGGETEGKSYEQKAKPEPHRHNEWKMLPVKSQWWICDQNIYFLLVLSIVFFPFSLWLWHNATVANVMLLLQEYDYVWKYETNSKNRTGRAASVYTSYRLDLKGIDPSS